MKKSKKFFSMLLAISMLLAMSLSVPAFAAEPSGKIYKFAGQAMNDELDSTNENGKQIFRDPVIVSDYFIDPALIGSTNPSSIMPLDDYNEIPVVREVLTTNKDVYVTPIEQPSLGYKGGSGGSAFFFSTGGSSVKFTVTINYKLATFTAETGKAVTTGSGYGAPIPAGTGNYRFQFIKYYVITSKIVDVYQYGEYKHSYTLHFPEYSLGHRWVKA